MTKRVAFQGEHGAYSEAAALEYFHEPIETVPCDTFDEVFEQVTAGACELGFIPIENTLGGSIHQNYDLLNQHSLSVIAEHVFPVRHCLIGLAEANLADIRKVISHPQALAQCKGYIRSLPNVKAEPVYDTAGSVKMIAKLGDPSIAAIASLRAAEIYKMKILAEAIQDHAHNFTRFLVISPQPAVFQGEAKTSIMLILKNEPGSLSKALNIFASRSINLAKIESRPLFGVPWNYRFYLDFNGSASGPCIAEALQELKQYAIEMRVLGSYPLHAFQY